MPVVIRPLRVDEAESYRAIRLEALLRHPDAFSASFERESTEQLPFFAARLAGSVVFAGFQGDIPAAENLLGTAGFMIQPGPKRQHKGLLWGMYVRREARGTGLARRLAEAVLDHAREHVELIQLSVVAGNFTAIRLYNALGFEPYGTEYRALKVAGRYLDEILMVKKLA
jgi:RimJ/RimL family protein N-acetyltransferase